MTKNCQNKQQFFFSWYQKLQFIIPRPLYRTSKLQEKPSVLKREHAALQKIKFLPFFFFEGLFCLPGAGSSWPKSMRIQAQVIHNTVQNLMIMILSCLFYIFLGHFCPPGSGSGLRSRAPCESGSNLDPDPQHVGTRIILSVPVGIRKVFLDHHKDVNTPYTRKRRGDITLHKISVDLPWHCISPSPCPVGVSQIPAPHNAHTDPLFRPAVCASYAAYHSQNKQIT